MARLLAAALVRRSAAFTASHCSITPIFSKSHLYAVSSSSSSSPLLHLFCTSSSKKEEDESPKFPKIPWDYLHYTAKFAEEFKKIRSSPEFRSNPPKEPTGPFKPTPSRKFILRLRKYFIKKYKFDTWTCFILAVNSRRMKDPRNGDLVVSFLKEKGFPDYRLELIIQQEPELCYECIETCIKPKFKLVEDLGFSADEANKMILGNYKMLFYPENSLKETISVLLDIMGKEDVIRLFTTRENLFKKDPAETFLKNIAALRRRKFSNKKINGMIWYFPHPYFHLEL